MQQLTPEQTVYTMLANHYGNDKDLWDERIEFGKEFVHMHPNKQEQIYGEADEPILMRKAFRAYGDMRAGRPTGFLASADATGSGIQILGIATGCVKTMQAVNVLNTGKRQDVYTNIDEGMGTNGVGRARIKKPIMTTFYGSKQEPKNIFGDDTPEYLAFMRSLEDNLTGAMLALHIIQSKWRSDVLAHTWKLPDGHIAKVKVMGEHKHEVNMGGVNFEYNYSVNETQSSGISLAANVTHSIDGYVVREMVRRAHVQGFSVLCIHDSFWCHPLFFNKMRQNYNNILAELADCNLLAYILGGIEDKPIKLEFGLNPQLAKEIRVADYPLS